MYAASAASPEEHFCANPAMVRRDQALRAQVVVTVAPEELLDALQVRYLRGELAALAAHPCGNFVVQALAGVASRPQQVKPCPQRTYTYTYLHTNVRVSAPRRRAMRLIFAPLGAAMRSGCGVCTRLPRRVSL